MKKLCLILLVFCGILIDNASIKAQDINDTIPKVRIFYFHATNRCDACLACENVCYETLQQLFPKELEEKTIVFQAINIDEGQNKPIVDQYKIQFSTLLFVDQKGNVTDLSDKAFETSLNNPLKYKEIIQNEVLRLLNE